MSVKNMVEMLLVTNVNSVEYIRFNLIDLGNSGMGTQIESKEELQRICEQSPGGESFSNGSEVGCKFAGGDKIMFRDVDGQKNPSFFVEKGGEE